MTTAEIANIAPALATLALVIGSIALTLATLALVIGSIALARTAPKASTDSSAEPRELTQTELDMINGQQGRYSTNADGTIKPRRPRKQRTPKPAPEAPTDAATTASVAPSATEAATTTTTGEPTHATQQP